MIRCVQVMRTALHSRIMNNNILRLCELAGVMSTIRLSDFPTEEVCILLFKKIQKV